ncbi:GAF domain-containing DNA-binding protein [Solirubrum puertoriconensis]|uniref:HTH LytTR-type domain-containing protein n=1 Tax=Solirubrum puertoriconensis TaxID=1751427 RepID=A0A9X0L5Y2_SOLP1|nr:GAF domain-containing DNA-binding protein [Solirubrum puertoriconensis]KUG09096.1 hypothetical protein ASU33_19955 [Solirubrum puertoriconensis]
MPQPTQPITSSNPFQQLPAAYTAQLLRAISDQGRLTALRAYSVLDTDPEEAFDNLARLAAYVCQAPVTLVTLLDEQQQFFKATHGYELPGSLPMEMTFCQHLLLASDLIEVEDTTTDARFRDNPFVAEQPHVRFYASAPLVTAEGHTIGSICAFDFKPHRLSEAQRDGLRALAHEAVLNLELRRAKVQLEQEQKQLEELLHQINEGGEAGISGGDQELFLKQDGRFVRVNTADVVYLEALGDYVHIHANSQRYTVYATLKSLLARLPAREFVQVHRKYIVRQSCIHTIAGDFLSLAGPQPVKVPIGPSHRIALLSRLNTI